MTSHANRPALTSVRGTRAADPEASIIPVLEAIGRGRPVLVVDDARDCGWMVCAADHATSEFLTLTSTYGLGVLRAAMDRDRLAALNVECLDPARLVFSPLDARGSERGRIGDRLRTLRLLADQNAGESDFVSPGHVFPVAADEPTESDQPSAAYVAVEAVRQAGRAPVAAMVQAVDEQGGPADRSACNRLARRLGLMLTSATEVLEQRARTFYAVERVVAATIPSTSGTLIAIGYRGQTTQTEYVAFRTRSIGEGLRVHIHRRCLLGDVFGGCECGGGELLRDALEEIHSSGNGTVIYFELGSTLPDGRDHHVEQLPFAVNIELAAIVRDLGCQRVFVSSTQSIDLDLFRRLGVRAERADLRWTQELRSVSSGLPTQPW